MLGKSWPLIVGCVLLLCAVNFTKLRSMVFVNEELVEIKRLNHRVTELHRVVQDNKLEQAKVNAQVNDELKRSAKVHGNKQHLKQDNALSTPMNKTGAAPTPSPTQMPTATPTAAPIATPTATPIESQGNA